MSQPKPDAKYYSTAILQCALIAGIVTAGAMGLVLVAMFLCIALGSTDSGR